MDTFKLKSWSEFRDYIFNNESVVPTYWRGQKDPSWPLASSFERKILNFYGEGMDRASMVYPYKSPEYPNGLFRSDDGTKLWEKGFLQIYRDSFIVEFKKASSGLRGETPKELTDDEWWALGRHSGLITPLLDWTEKPFIAAFFAMTELWVEMTSKGSEFTWEDSIQWEDQEVSIYRLIHDQNVEGDGFRIVQPVVDELSRMHGQRSLFTWLDSEEYFELEGFVNNTGREKFLTRIVLSGKSIWQGLKDFREYGIDYRTLFPDLHGAALHANAQLDLNTLGKK